MTASARRKSTPRRRASAKGADRVDRQREDPAQQDAPTSTISSLLSVRATARATVTGFGEDGVLVRTSDRSDPFPCDLLWTSDQARLSLGIDDQVLVVIPSPIDARGVVLGRVAPYEAPDQRRITLEAEEAVELKCGSSRVSLRADGKVVVRGNDVVTWASGRNRIKGGSVDIN